jgi:hypothetical protein
MKNKLFLSKLLFGCMTLAIVSCQESLPENRSFPIIRTLEPLNVDEAGATFKAESITMGGGSTTGFGFVWDQNDPVLNSANKIELGTTLPSGEFEIRVESHLSKGVDYKIRAYAIQNGKTIYGNIVSFISKGSKNATWGIDKIITDVLGGFLSFGGADNKYGYILYQLGECYKYDTEKKVATRIEDFPKASNSGAKFTTCTFNGVLYVAGGNSSNLYKFENNSWSFVSQLPFNYESYGGYLEAFSANGLIYLISSHKSYAYDPSINFWYFIPAPVFSSYSIAGSYSNGKAYLIMFDKSFWEYDIVSGDWTELQTYPGKNQDGLVSYQNNSKLHFGLNKDPNFWVFDILSGAWLNGEKFPVTLEGIDLQFHFSIGNKLYYGLANGRGNFTIWNFEPLPN